MKLSVIVPALNESENIVQAVSSALTAGAEEVIVVDGGSQDDTVERATAAGAICLASQPGRAQQLHHGASHARGEMLVFLHADNWFGQDALAPLLENAPVNRGDPLNCGGFIVGWSGATDSASVGWARRMAIRGSLFAGRFTKPAADFPSCHSWRTFC